MPWHPSPFTRFLSQSLAPFPLLRLCLFLSDPHHTPLQKGGITPLSATAFQQDLARRCGLPGSAAPRRSRQASAARGAGSTGPAPPTLSQRLGLVPAAPQLSASEWRGVRQASQTRGDSEQPCAICAEPFALQLQVLLSCSHTFHSACLGSFERFSGRRCCPICRAADYDKQLIDDGLRHHRQQMAIRIQAAWRGFVSRRRHLAPSQARLQRLSAVTERLVSAAEQRHSDVDAFLQEMDSSLAKARQTFATAAAAAAARRRAAAPEPSAAAASRSCTAQPLSPLRLNDPSVDWKAVHDRAKRAGRLAPDAECPICITRLAPLERTCVLLSCCASLFHQTCLSSFQLYAEKRPQEACPMCRSAHAIFKLDL